jgi:hypothetical protein
MSAGARHLDVYRARPIRSERRTRAQIEQLDRQILEVLRSDRPQSVRHLFYRMTDPRLPEPVEKSERGYRHVQHRCVKLRRAGLLPYGWITDATRRGYFTPTYRSAGDFLRSVAGHYRADLWEWSRYYVEVWVESRSLAGVVEDLCRTLAVSLYPCGGFSSITLAYEAARYINSVAEAHPEKLIRILYVGDYDPAGVLIDVALERELCAHLAAGIDLKFSRLGITPEQIRELDLPRKPRKVSDRRALHVESTVEAEAMPAHLLRELLRRNIEALLPEDALSATKVAEESERAHLERIASLLEARP